MPRKTLLLITKQCRQCGKPFATTNSIAVVHSECRIAYYQKLSRDSYRKNTRNRPADVRGRKKCFVNDQSHSCEACGSFSLTKEKKFWHQPAEGETEGKFVQHTLCFQCIAMYRFGIIEALTWKPLLLSA